LEESTPVRRKGAPDSTSFKGSNFFQSALVQNSWVYPYQSGKGPTHTKNHRTWIREEGELGHREPQIGGRLLQRAGKPKPVRSTSNHLKNRAWKGDYVHQGKGKPDSLCFPLIRMKGKIECWRAAPNPPKERIGPAPGNTNWGGGHLALAPTEKELKVPASPVQGNWGGQFYPNRNKLFF